MSEGSPSQLQNLLAEAQWVKTLARSMVHDQGTADDLAQDVQLAALQRRPAGDLRAWLAAVLRNLLRRKQRNDGIRERHERIAAQNVIAGDEGEARCRVELQRALAEAILELDDAHRQVIVARFFDQRSYGEISASHGLSEPALRKRLSRALEKLRQSIRRRGFERLLFAAVPIPAFGQSAAKMSLTTLGGTVMGWKFACTLAVAALLTVGLVLWSQAPLAPETATAESPTSDAGQLNDTEIGGDALNPVRDAPRTRMAEMSAAADKQAAAAQPARSMGILRGRVSDSSGERIAGAKIEVRRVPLREYGTRDPELESSRPEVRLALTASDEDGEFRVDLPIGQSVDLWIEAAGFSKSAVPERVAGEFVEIRLGRGARFHGSVRRASDGLPVAGAQLMSWRDDSTRLPVFEGETDRTGSFSFTDLEPGPIRVLVSHDELASPNAPIAVELTEGGEQQMDFSLDAGIRIEGRVLDADTSLPIADAAVGQGWRLFKSTQTDAWGRFALAGFGRDGNPEIHVRAEGYGRAIRPLNFSDKNVTEIEIRLSKGFRVTGRVLNKQGRPLSNSYVAGVAELGHVDDSLNSDWCSTVTNEKGQFTLRDLRVDSAHLLWVIREGYAPLMAKIPDAEGRGQVDLGTLQLEGGGNLSGIIVDENDIGISNCRLKLVGRGDNPLVGTVRDEQNRWTDDLVYLNQRTGRTNDAGNFQFSDLSYGEYELQVSRYREGALTVTEEFDGTIRQTLEIKEGRPIEGLRIVLQTGQRISGQVVNSAGAPVAGMLVWLSPRDGSDKEVNMVTSADGRFDFRHLASEAYQFQAFPTNIGGEEPPYQAVEIPLLQAGDVDVRVVLEDAAITAGMVVSTNGTPAIKASVIALDAEGRELERSFTESDGSFALNLQPGIRVDLLARPAPSDGPFWNPKFFPKASEGTVLTGIESGKKDLRLKLPKR